MCAFQVSYSPEMPMRTLVTRQNNKVLIFKESADTGELLDPGVEGFAYGAR
jgi:hypothetical protein